MHGLFQGDFYLYLYLSSLCCHVVVRGEMFAPQLGEHGTSGTSGTWTDTPRPPEKILFAFDVANPTP
jgi:hypothetical protein